MDIPGTVDLLINGHSHVHERTDAVRGGGVGRALLVGGSTDPARDGIVRYAGFAFLRVEAEAGTAPRLKVSAPAQSGARIDHFEIHRGG